MDINDINKEIRVARATLKRIKDGELRQEDISETVGWIACLEYLKLRYYNI